MSSRRTLNKTEESKNPATQFLEWKSKDKCFSYYSKEKGENVKVEIPFHFQFLEHFHTIKGWHDPSKSGIYSNEVKFISKEPLKVRAFKGGDLVEGVYSDIRGDIRDNGGKYHRSVYIVLESGEIANLSFKGAAVSAYSDFMAENENKVEGAWMEVNSAKDHKKGATKYSTPVFSIGAKYTDADSTLADEKYLEIVEYFNKYTANKFETIEEEEEIEF